MLIKENLGNIQLFETGDRRIDTVNVEWFEAQKRIMHKQSAGGHSLAFKFLQRSPDLKDGDVLHIDDHLVIIVAIKSCEAIVIKPTSILEASSVCYEIGNKHLPLFHNKDDELLVPFDKPLFDLLQASGFAVKKEERILDQPIKTSVLPHGNRGGNDSLFNKILKLTTTS